MGLLGGSWVVKNGNTSPLKWVTGMATLLITPLITTREPPSKVGLSVGHSLAAK